MGLFVGIVFVVIVVAVIVAAVTSVIAAGPCFVVFLSTRSSYW